MKSVESQGFKDLEVIISDNCSDEDYIGVISDFKNLNIRYIKTKKILSVTENWNNALSEARGRYVLMLGDDDALAPGCLFKLADAIQKFDSPDLIYIKAYHYTYPEVISSSPKGGFVEVGNSPVFDRNDGPYRLDQTYAHKLALRAFNLRHEISFNAQHFILKREFALQASGGSFYQSPYPDFFAAMVVFRRAQSIVVLPSPEIIIGIAKESFGFFFSNKREKEGFDRFATDPLDVARLTGGNQEIEGALALPGSGHWRNWFIAALFARQSIPEFAGLMPDLRRYRRIQLMELAQRREIFGQIGALEFWQAVHAFGRNAKHWARLFRRLSREVARLPAADRVAAASSLRERLNIHYPARVRLFDIGRHRHIMDAFDWLASNPTRRAPSLPLKAFRMLAEKVRERLAAR